MMRTILFGVAGLALMGCAASVDDPSPAPTPLRPGADPPAQTFSGEFRQPASQFEIVIQDSTMTQIPEIAKETPPNLPGR